MAPRSRRSPGFGEESAAVHEQQDRKGAASRAFTYVPLCPHYAPKLKILRAFSAEHSSEKCLWWSGHECMPWQLSTFFVAASAPGHLEFAMFAFSQRFSKA